MIYKSADPKDVGSMTSSNSCIRNAYGALLGFSAGWLIYFFGHNFRIGFVIGIVMSTVGLLMFLVHHWQMRRDDDAETDLIPELEPVPEPVSETAYKES